MNQLQLTRELLLGQLKKYPKLQPEGMLKGLYQSEFGCGHFITDEKKGMDLLDKLRCFQEMCITDELPFDPTNVKRRL